VRARGTSAQPPGWDGAPRGEPGIHGIPRARRWDVVAAAPAPELAGDEVAFVALPDGTLLSADAPAAALAPIAAALHLEPPYRAEAVRRDERHWAAAAARIRVLELPGVEGHEVEVVANGSAVATHVDDRPWPAGLPALERVGRANGDAFVVRARRLAGTLWEVESAAL
jgi:hypothetical protein